MMLTDILILSRFSGWRPGACFLLIDVEVGVVCVWIHGTDSFTMSEMESSTL